MSREAELFEAASRAFSLFYWEGLIENQADPDEKERIKTTHELLQTALHKYTSFFGGSDHIDVGVFDLLQALVSRLEQEPSTIELSKDIRAGYARGTGGVDVPHIVDCLAAAFLRETLPAPEPDDEPGLPELKPCPFCGGEAKMLKAIGEGPPYIATCSKCPASMSLNWIEEEAVREWNTRAIIAQALAVQEVPGEVKRWAEVIVSQPGAAFDKQAVAEFILSINSGGSRS